MACRREGRVVERHWKSGRGYALRFWAYGARRYLTLGLESEGWTYKRAEVELANVMADVRRGIWVPPERHQGARAPEADGGAPLFATFARGILAAHKGQLAERSIELREWTLSHLVPYFGDWRVSEIDVEAVDAYRAHKIAEAEAIKLSIEQGRPTLDKGGRPLRPLSASSINKTIGTLQWVLGFAVEYGHMPDYRNPAQGKRRRLPTPKSRPIYLDTAEQIEALLDAAAELDAEAKRDRSSRERECSRQAILATLALAGLRAHELCNLCWRDVDLANGRINVTASKTQAGLREVDLGLRLREILTAHKAAAQGAGADDLVFPTLTGTKRDQRNLRNRVLGASIKCADGLLEKRGQTPLPRGLSPHKLRHTFASVLIACGEDPASVMAQLGHTSPAFTLRVYTHMMRRGPGERERLQALMRGDGAGAADVDVSITRGASAG